MDNTNDSVARLAEEILFMALNLDNLKLNDFGKSQLAKIEALLRETIAEENKATIKAYDTGLKRGEEMAYTRAAEVVRAKFFEALKQNEPAEEWLAAAIEKLKEE